MVTAGVGGALMGGVLTATRMLGWRAYKVKQMIDGVYSAEADASAVAISAS